MRNDQTKRYNDAMGVAAYGNATLRIAIVMAFIGTIAASSSGQDNSAASAPTKSFAQDALPSTNWYRPDEGTVVPVTVQTSVDDSVNRDSRWLPKPKQVAKKAAPPAPNATPAGANGGGWFGTNLTLGNLLAWFFLVAIIAGLVGTLIYALSKSDIDLSSHPRSNLIERADNPDEQTIERMKHLPAELRRTDVNLRSEALRLMNQGQYDQAVILLFAHQLLLLDRVSILRLNRGKTNGKYVRETHNADAQIGALLKQTTHAFERSYFGRQQITDAEFRDLWELNETLEGKVQLHHEVAA